MKFLNREAIEAAKEVLRTPKLVIDCFGDEYARQLWADFNRRHPRIPIFRRKTFGAAMREIPHVDQIMEGPQFATSRRAARKAEKAGYTFRAINPADHFEQIMDVNLSSGERQGRPVNSSYTDHEKVKAYHSLPGEWFGVFDKEGILQAYTHAPVFGDAFTFDRLLGNSSLLQDGIMHLLVAETIRAMAVKRDAVGFPKWANYDMLVGAGPGLREFKRRTGFQPRRVKWRWVKK